jgi:pimeloyl-ACP methyl ester carboxylesterase
MGTGDGSRFMDPLGAACPATCPRLPDEAAIGLRHRFVELGGTASGVRLHLVEAGSGPLVLLLHGFPEFWYGWRAQIPALADHFHVVAPDLRGYNLSDKPASGYDFETLAADVPALVRALGAERAHVVGHDWGGMVAWGAAMLHPEVVDRLAILNAPHPGAYLRELGRNPKQWLRSWYIGLFQVRWLAEGALTRGHGQGVADLLLSTTVEPECFWPDHLPPYRRAILRPDAARATLAYYRALVATPPWRVQRLIRPIPAASLLIWGMKDPALVPELTSGLERWVPDLRVERIPDASHWVQHERPALVNRLLLAHLKPETPVRGRGGRGVSG